MPQTGSCWLQVEMDAGFGQRCPVDLLPGGGNVPVTSANVRQYCELYAQHLLVHSIQKQFAAFQRGFLRLCSGAALQLFRCGAYTLKPQILKCLNPQPSLQLFRGGARAALG